MWFFMSLFLFAVKTGNACACLADTSHKKTLSAPGKIVQQQKKQQADTVTTINGKKIAFHKKHRFIAAVLALPFPFGIFGLHRIYMHTSAVVPVVYIATLGGGLGILPFIDFVLILLNKDIHTNYTSNKHLFMWEKRDFPSDTLKVKR
jgi:TM2 domain-containing membrane protein YozV